MLHMESRRQLTRYAWLSIAAAVLTIGLKTAAFQLTGSIGLLSDALESVLNIITAGLALVTLIIAARPPDEDHAFGHSKAEYLAAGIEGLFVLGAASLIAYQAVIRLLNPVELEAVGIGVGISAVAAVINLLVGRVLLRAGTVHRSATLTAEAHHLLADVWTSVGVIAGVGAVALTGWQWLDPLIALVVAAQIVILGVRLLRQTMDGLMDVALPGEEIAAIESILNDYSTGPVTYHALRTRQSGAQRFVSVHIQVPGTWSVQRGHELLEEVESDIRAALPPVTVFTHIEPAEDPASWNDIVLIRPDNG